jgi:hypothetical protein
MHVTVVDEGIYGADDDVCSKEEMVEMKEVLMEVLIRKKLNLFGLVIILP